MESSALQVTDVPYPKVAESPRAIALDIGLRHAERTFHELVVPGMARVWFARQLSWSCAALLLYQQINNRSTTVPSPTRIAHGIEALSTKAALFCRETSDRHLGQDLLDPRRHEAQRTGWTFAHISCPDGYVDNTHRAAAAPALRHDNGLGLARGTGFDLMLLEPAGRTLAQAFLDQPVSDTDTLGTALTRWVHGDDILAYAPMQLNAVLSAHRLTDAERTVIAAAVLHGADGSARKRRQLAALLGSAPACPDVEGVLVPALHAAGHGQQGNEILAARAFGALQSSTLGVIAAVTAGVAQDGSITFAKAVQMPAVAEALDEAYMGAQVFRDMATVAHIEEPSATYFAESVIRAHGAEATLRVLLQRVPQLLNISRTKATQGPQFRVFTVDRWDDTFRLANFHNLLRDLSHLHAV